MKIVRDGHKFRPFFGFAEYERNEDSLGFTLLEIYSVSDTLACSPHEMRFRQ